MTYGKINFKTPRKLILNTPFIISNDKILLTTILSFKSILHSKAEDNSLE